MSKTSPSTARYIAANVWKSQGDIRDVISIGKLVRKSDGPREIEQIMNTMAKYDNMMMQGKRELDENAAEEENVFIISYKSRIICATMCRNLSLTLRISER